jgi:hypothetical protein
MTAIGTPGDNIYFGPKAITVGGQAHVFVATGPPRSSRRYGLQIKYASWNGKSWSNFTALPDPASKLSTQGTVKLSNGFSFVRTLGSKKLQLFALTEEAFPARISLEGTKWSSWEIFEDGADLNGFDNIPYAVSEGNDKVGYYAQRWDNSSIAYKQWDGSKFIPSGKAWLHINIPGLNDGVSVADWLFSSPPDLSSQHVWLLLTNYTLAHATLRGGELSGLESLGDAGSVLPIVSHRDSTSIDITSFITDEHFNSPGVRSFDGKKWGSWQKVKGAKIGSWTYASPAVAFTPPNNLHVFDVTFERQHGLVSAHKNNGTWFPKLDEYDDLFQFYSTAPAKTSIMSKAISAGQQVLKQWL